MATFIFLFITRRTLTSGYLQLQQIKIDRLFNLHYYYWFFLKSFSFSIHLILLGKAAEISRIIVKSGIIMRFSAWQGHAVSFAIAIVGRNAHREIYRTLLNNRSILLYVLFERQRLNTVVYICPHYQSRLHDRILWTESIGDNWKLIGLKAYGISY